MDAAKVNKGNLQYLAGEFWSELIRATFQPDPPNDLLHRAVFMAHTLHYPLVATDDEFKAHYAQATVIDSEQQTRWNQLNLYMAKGFQEGLVSKLAVPFYAAGDDPEED